MRPLACLMLLSLCRPCAGWDTTPHQRITRAALDTLPANLLHRFGAEIDPLVELYCIFPDLYLEQERFGFVRKGPGPRDLSEIKPYCVRPDGQPLHGATGDPDTDTGSLVYLFERILTNFSQRRPAEAAKFAGVLSHYIADSLSPPHAASSGQLRDMAPPSAEAGKIDLHAALERSLPEFGLSHRAPRMLGTRVLAVAQAVLRQCATGAEENRRDLPSIVRAACAGDERTLDVYRLRAGTKAAALLADVLYTLCRIAGEQR